ncbi:hypothetical protein PMAYCL1PPCAC_23888, partial [Pristionchus mayeri]
FYTYSFSITEGRGHLLVITCPSPTLTSPKTPSSNSRTRREPSRDSATFAFSREPEGRPSPLSRESPRSTTSRRSADTSRSEMERNHFISFLLLRLLLSLITSTWFVPDELFQSAEPAHSLIFGSGHLSWEWTRGLRSPLHALILSIPLYMIKMISFDTPFTVFYLPRLLHSTLFLLSDIAFSSLTYRFLPTQKARNIVLCMYASNWFINYCSPRTLGNSLETCFTLLSLTQYPFTSRECSSKCKSVPLCIFLATLSIILRPTSALLWIVLGLRLLWIAPDPLSLVFSRVLPSMLPTLFISTLLDSWWYGRWLSSLYEFLSFNVLEGGSVHFGVHPLYWYFVDGLPAVFTLSLIPILYGAFGRLSSRPPNVILSACLFYLLVHTFLPHKEHRFILPIVPLLLLYSSPLFVHPSKLSSFLFNLTIVTNIVLTLYMSLIHQRGPFAIGQSILSRSTPSDSLLILAPCYSLPGHSFFHSSIGDIYALDCSPPLNGSTILDEADAFHSDPIGWVERKGRSLDVYSFIVVYEKMWRVLEETLGDTFAPCHKEFHAHFLVSSRQDHYIILLCKVMS